MTGFQCGPGRIPSPPKSPVRIHLKHHLKRVDLDPVGRSGSRGSIWIRWVDLDPVGRSGSRDHSGSGTSSYNATAPSKFEVPRPQGNPGIRYRSRSIENRSFVNVFVRSRIVRSLTFSFDRGSFVGFGAVWKLRRSYGQIRKYRSSDLRSNIRKSGIIP